MTWKKEESGIQSKQAGKTAQFDVDEVSKEDGVESGDAEDKGKVAA